MIPPSYFVQVAKNLKEQDWPLEQLKDYAFGFIASQKISLICNMASKKVVDEFYKKNLVLKYIKERMGKEDYDKFIKFAYDKHPHELYKEIKDQTPEKKRQQEGLQKLQETYKHLSDPKFRGPQDYIDKWEAKMKEEQVMEKIHEEFEQFRKDNEDKYQEFFGGGKQEELWKDIVKEARSKHNAFYKEPQNDDKE